MEKERKEPAAGPPYALRVARIVDETTDARSLVLEIPNQLTLVFRYRAGQFLTVQIPCDGKTLSRCYSLSSAPECDAEYKVTVKRVAGGRISNWINDRVRTGDIIECFPPGGVFTLTAAVNDLVLFAGGSGITPVISLVKSALATTLRRVRLIYQNRDVAATIFGDEIRVLATMYPERLEVVNRYDDCDGYVELEHVKPLMSDRPDAEFYVCGPAEFMNIVERGLLEAGVSEERIHIERFVSPPDPDDPPETGVRSTALEVPRVVSVALEGSVYQVACAAGQTVLSAGQAAGIRPPFSCTEGFCGCCMAKVVRGQVRMKQNDFLSKKEVEQGWVLTCQSIPLTDDVEVRYPE